MRETRWCSYRELAEEWSVAVPAAKARARRARWRRIEGNDGVARIEVPVEVTEHGKSARPMKLKNVLRALKESFKIWLNLKT